MALRGPVTGLVLAAMTACAAEAADKAPARKPAPPKTPPAHAATAKPSAKPAAPAAAPAPPLPSLTGSWRQVSRGTEQLALVDAGSVRLAGDKADVTLALVLRAPIRDNGMNGAIVVDQFEMDCKAGSGRTRRTTAFDETGKPQGDTGLLSGEFQTPPPGSNFAILIAMACGTRPLPQQPQWTDPMVARRGWLGAG
jgi:hypothetical protein